MFIRKTLIIKETTTGDELGRPCDPVNRVAALVVIANPFAASGADTDQDDLSSLFSVGAQVGDDLAQQIVDLLPNPPVGYGKAAMVGTSGAMEHGAALVHPKLGAPMRKAVGGGASLIPSNVKLTPLGDSIDLPLGHKDEAWSFDHIDTMTLMVGDAPRSDEIVVCMAVSDGPRIHPRVGKGPQKTL